MANGELRVDGVTIGDIVSLMIELNGGSRRFKPEACCAPFAEMNVEWCSALESYAIVTQVQGLFFGGTYHSYHGVKFCLFCGTELKPPPHVVDMQAGSLKLSAPVARPEDEVTPPALPE